MAYRYGNNYNASNYGMARIGDVGALVESIKPDINEVYNSAKRKRNLFLVFIFICPILFMGGFVTAFTTETYGLIAFGVIGFMGLPVSGLIMGFFANKAAKIKLVIDLKNEIEVRDKTNLDDLSLSKYTGKNSVILIINKLIQTHNLRNYEVIGNVGVARTELRARERDFVSAAVTDALNVAKENIQNTQSAQRRYRCPGCGAPITEQTGKFCTFCGVRLE